MRIQLWSYKYDPEPTGIAPLSTVWAKATIARGHKIQVVAAHPHYPEPEWGRRLKPYVLRNEAGRRGRGEAARIFARRHVSSDHVAERFEATLTDALHRRSRPRAVAVGGAS